MMTCLTRLGDVCELINGGAWKQNEYVDDGIPVVQVSNMKKGTIDISDLKFLPTTSYDRYKKHSLKECDLVIATVGSHATQASAAGRATIIKEFAAGMLLNQNAVSIRSKSKSLDQDYLGLIARSNDFQFYLGTVGQGAANQVRIALSSIKEYKCVLPPIGIQRRMVEIISAYDDLIENNRRRIQLLEQAARLLYKEWFVHLRFPGHEHVTITDGVPEGWEIGRVGNLADVKSGYAFKSKDWQQEGNQVIKIKNIVGDGTIDISSCDCVSDNVAESASKFTIEEGTLLIAMTGATVGKVGIMPKILKSLFLNQRVGQFRSKYYNHVENFLFPFFQGELAQTQVQNLARGAAQPNISGAKIESIELLVPEKKILDLYLDSTKGMFQQRQYLLELNGKLTQARDLLLPRLMNGELPL